MPSFPCFRLSALALVAGLSFSSLASAQLETLREAAEGNTSDAAAQSAYGEALRIAGQYERARRVLQRAARLSGESLESLYAVARVAFSEGDYHRARGACRALERHDRDAALTHICRARAFLVWQRAGRAFEELEIALEREPGSFEGQLALADANRFRHDHDASLAAYQRAISIDGNRVEGHFGLGLLHIANGDQAAATTEFRAALNVAPHHSGVHFQLALLEDGNAREHLLAALRDRPRWTEALVKLGDVEREGENWQAARERYQAAIAVEEESAPAHAGLGLVFAAEGEFGGAEQELRRALEIVPNSADYALSLARVFEQAGRQREAFTQYRHAADLAPANPVGLLDAAALALQVNRDVLAAGFLDRFMEANPNVGRAHRLYGDVMRARYDRGRALEHYRRALELGGVNEGEVNEAIAAVQAEQAQRTPVIQRGN